MYRFRGCYPKTPIAEVTVITAIEHLGGVGVIADTLTRSPPRFLDLDFLRREAIIC
jgi:hypothetical protein